MEKYPEKQGLDSNFSIKYKDPCNEVILAIPSSQRNFEDFISYYITQEQIDLLFNVTDSVTDNGKVYYNTDYCGTLSYMV